jgi:mono/diheme cytochrome c family protein
VGVSHPGTENWIDQRNRDQAMMRLTIAAVLVIGGFSAAAELCQATEVPASAPAQSTQIVAGQSERGSRLYAAACSSCHYRGKGKPDFSTPGPIGSSLGLKGKFGGDDPEEVIRTILFGLSEFWSPEMKMPAFSRALTDTDIADVAAYMRATGSKQPPWPDLEKQVSNIRAQSK